MAMALKRRMQEEDDTDPAIIEIYVAIQARQFGQAVQLSRQPGVAAAPLARALGALALSHAGRRQEAVEQAQRLAASGRATHIKVLSVIAEVFSRHGMHMEKRLLYQNACQRAPESVELQAELFFCLVHDEDYDKQKTVAMKLFKAGHTMFGTWAATALCCNMTAHPGAPNNALFGKLAARLLDKSTAAAEPEAAEGEGEGAGAGAGAVVGEANRLHLDVMIANGSYVAALDKLKTLEAVAAARAAADGAAADAPAAVSVASAAAHAADRAAAEAAAAAPAEATPGTNEAVAAAEAGVLSGLDADGARAGMLSLAEILEYQAACHERLGQWRAAHALHLRHLREFDADAWDRYEGLVRCALHSARADRAAAQEGEGSDGGAAPAAPVAGDEVLALIREQQQQQLVEVGGAGSSGTTSASASGGAASAKVPRGPFLAEVHLLFTALRAHSEDEGLVLVAPAVLGGGAPREALEVAFATALIAYVDRFGSKGCCYDDTSAYVRAIGGGGEGGGLLSRANAARFVAATKATLTANVSDAAAIEALAGRLAAAKASGDGDGGGNGGSDGAAADDQRELRHHKLRLCRYICAHKMRRSLGLPAAAADGGDDAEGTAALDTARRALVTELVREYRATLALNGGGVGGQREVQVGDDLLLLAAHFLLDLAARAPAAAAPPRTAAAAAAAPGPTDWLDARGQALRLEALELLEIGHRQSPHNFQMRLLLVRLYTRVAAVPRALRVFGTFDVKHVQLDTLTQLLFPALRRHGFTDAADDWATRVFRFHDRADFEMHHYVRTAYEHRNFTKAVELVKFHQRLRSSRQLLVCETALATMGLRGNTRDPARYLQQVEANVSRRIFTMPSANFAALRDNYDDEVHATWDPAIAAAAPATPAVRRADDNEVELWCQVLLTRALKALLASNTKAIAAAAEDFAGLVARSDAAAAHPKLFGAAATGTDSGGGGPAQPLAELVAEFRGCTDAAFQLYLSRFVFDVVVASSASSEAQQRSELEPLLARLLSAILPAIGEALPLTGSGGALWNLDEQLQGLDLGDGGGSGGGGGGGGGKKKNKQRRNNKGKAKQDSEPDSAKTAAAPLPLAAVFSSTSGLGKTWILLHDFCFWLATLLPRVFASLPKQAPAPSSKKPAKGKGKKGKGKGKGKGRGGGGGGGGSGLAGVHQQIVQVMDELGAQADRLVKRVRQVAAGPLGSELKVSCDDLATYAPASVADLAAHTAAAAAAGGAAEAAKGDHDDDADAAASTRTALRHVVDGLKMCLTRLANRARDNSIIYKGIKLK